MIGSTLGPYRVVEQVGEGGMGVVYRATDTQLGRDVAIKILPPSVANDADRLARFEREARLLASLNHPNIASVFGVEQGALVMEMIEGPTIADRLRTQPFSLEETIEIAVQVCDALEAAHEKGIVHRDLKPANIKLTPTGLVKVLDFGLAKAIADEASAAPANSPTMTAAFSKTGIIMGTAAYMSPEQARGAHIDQRTDIWAFGLVLFEMLCRRQMFGGETVADSLAGVLKSPILFDSLPPETPVSIRRLLKRCLERDRRKRLRDIADARLELLAASEEEPAAVSTSLPSPTRRAFLPWTAAAVSLLAAAALAGWTFTRPQPPPPHSVRFTVPPPSGLKHTGSLAISPDGRWAAFVQTSLSATAGSGQLFFRALDSLDARRIEAAPAAAALCWSPDSRSIAYFDNASKRLMKVSVEAAVPEIVTAIKSTFLGVAWHPDGTILYIDDGQLFQISSAGGTPRKLSFAGLGGEKRSYGVHILPGGKGILHLQIHHGGKTDLRATDLENGSSKVLATGVSLAEYDSGHLLYVRDGTLMARPFDRGRLEFTGDPFRVEAAVETNTNGRRGYFATNGNGILALRRPSGEVQSLAWFGRDGRELGPFPQGAINGNHHEVSPDGRRVAFGNSTVVTDNGDIWVADIERGVNTRLTSHPALDWVSVWSPDSRRLAFTTNRNNGAYSSQIYVVDADKPGSEKPLLVDDKPKHHMAWSPDGKQIVYETYGPGGGYDLWFAPVDGSAKPAPLVTTEFTEAQPSFSPDGRWLSYISNRTGRFEVCVREFAGGPSAAVVQISSGGGIQPRWRKDGKEILYLAADGHIMSVPVQSAAAAFIPGNPIRLFRSQLEGLHAATHFTMSSDGQRFLLPSLGAAIRQEPLIFVVNWLPRQGRQR